MKFIKKIFAKETKEQEATPISSEPPRISFEGLGFSPSSAEQTTIQSDPKVVLSNETSQKPEDDLMILFRYLDEVSPKEVDGTEVVRAAKPSPCMSSTDLDRRQPSLNPSHTDTPALSVLSLPESTSTMSISSKTSSKSAETKKATVSAQPVLTPLIQLDAETGSLRSMTKMKVPRQAQRVVTTHTDPPSRRTKSRRSSLNDTVPLAMIKSQTSPASSLDKQKNSKSKTAASVIPEDSDDDVPLALAMQRGSKSATTSPNLDTRMHDKLSSPRSLKEHSTVPIMPLMDPHAQHQLWMNYYQRVAEMQQQMAMMHMAARPASKRK